MHFVLSSWSKKLFCSAQLHTLIWKSKWPWPAYKSVPKTSRYLLYMHFCPSCNTEIWSEDDVMCCCLPLSVQIWWLDSELTCGQSRPLVFTQGHSVCNRSFFPCFDTPAVKSTYTATVRVGRHLSLTHVSHTCIYSCYLSISLSFY